PSGSNVTSHWTARGKGRTTRPRWSPTPCGSWSRTCATWPAPLRPGGPSCSPSRWPSGKSSSRSGSRPVEALHALEELRGLSDEALQLFSELPAVVESVAVAGIRLCLRPVPGRSLRAKAAPRPHPPASPPLSAALRAGPAPVPVLLPALPALRPAHPGCQRQALRGAADLLRRPFTPGHQVPQLLPGRLDQPGHLHLRVGDVVKQPRQLPAARLA